MWRIWAVWDLPWSHEYKYENRRYLRVPSSSPNAAQVSNQDRCYKTWSIWWVCSSLRPFSTTPIESTGVVGTPRYPVCCLTPPSGRDIKFQKKKLKRNQAPPKSSNAFHDCALNLNIFCRQKHWFFNVFVGRKSSDLDVRKSTKVDRIGTIFKST